MGKTKGKIKSGIKKISSFLKTSKPLAKLAVKASPLGRISNVVTAVKTVKDIPKKINQKMGRTARTAKGKSTGRKKQTVASIKKKILMLKLKKELAKVRGY